MDPKGEWCPHQLLEEVDQCWRQDERLQSWQSNQLAGSIRSQFQDLRGKSEHFSSKQLPLKEPLFNNSFLR